jgi:hypothetical protein
MGVEARRERIEARIECVEPRIHPTDERVEPSIDVIEPIIDMIETSIHSVEPGDGPRSEGVDARSQVEQRAERHGGEDRESGPDGGIHLIASVAPRCDRLAGNFSSEADTEIGIGRP